MAFAAVVFDKDGVLVDSERLKAKAWHDVLIDHGVVKGDKWYFSKLGPTAVTLAKMARRDFKIATSAKRLAEQWRTFYREIEQGVEPIGANIDLLKALSQQYAIAVASSADRDTIEAELTRFGCRRYVSVLVSGEETPRNKPAPDVYVTAARMLRFKSNACIVVEDSPAGVAAAKAAGMFCVGYKNSSYKLKLDAADLVVDDLSIREAFQCV